MSYPGPTYNFDEGVARRILEVAAQDGSEILVSARGLSRRTEFADYEYGTILATILILWDRGMLVLRERNGRNGSDEPDYLVTGLTALGRREYRARALG